MVLSVYVNTIQICIITYLNNLITKQRKKKKKHCRFGIMTEFYEPFFIPLGLCVLLIPKVVDFGTLRSFIIHMLCITANGV